MNTPSRTWNRHLSDDQRHNLEALLDALELPDAALVRPASGDRVPVTIHVTPEFAAYLGRLAAEYGCHSKTELARLAVLGWAKTSVHPGRVKRAREFR